ncbi:TolB family protein [Candidatus Leptofilum sp.]|uniref:TolB family protein n=1 Tax=Candidatus Leptofilum sp. TaxID=3241576 RepID=UPI003B597DA0
MSRLKIFAYLFLLCAGLAGCLPESTNQITVAVTREQSSSTATVTKTVTAVPLPTEHLPTLTPLPSPTAPSASSTALSSSGQAIPTEAILPPPPKREQVDNLTAVSANAIAYVQNDQLFIRTLLNGETIPVHTEPCPEERFCFLAYPKWVPDGQHLLYVYYDGQTSSLRMSNKQGTVQIIEEIAFIRPGAWSPDGRTIVYFKETDTYFEPEGDNVLGEWLFEVWTVTVAENGNLATPQLAGTWRQPGGGCGGGGRSLSEVLYENEGGTPYGYRMGVLEWTVQNILLYTRDCSNIGIGRFDMTSGMELPSFERPLRNLVLNASGDRWYAVTGNAWVRDNPESNLLVTGTPDSTEITVIPTTAQAELVFVGQTSGTLFYTERNPLGRESYDDRGLYFAYYESALWRIQPDGTGEERLLFGADVQAYAQVEETAVGDLIFVLVENERPLFEAAQFDSLTEEQLQAYFPQRHIMLLPAAGGEPITILSNAGQPTLALP